MNRKRKLFPSVAPSFTQNMQHGHKLIGLAIGAVMYLVCVTGVICVFYPQIERWEKPDLPEMATAEPAALGAALSFARERLPEAKDQFGAPASEIFIGVPNREMPRIIASIGEENYGFDAEGHPAGSAMHEFTHFICELHYSLNLPMTLGLIVVGVIGAGLIALIFGGLLSLPRVFRDAFRLRLSGSTRLTHTDVHNRIGVWGAPFYLVIAASGAIMGLASVMLMLAGGLHFGGDLLKAKEAVFGSPAVFERGEAPGVGAPAIEKAFAWLAENHPDRPALFIGVREIGAPTEHLELWATDRERLVYAETYLFDVNGDYAGAMGYSDGDFGKQLYTSMFRLHVGGFGGVLVQLFYALLGAGLCLVCTTGIDIWLMKSAAKGKRHERLHRMWTAFVWGTPTLIAMAAALEIWVLAPLSMVFWIGLAALCLACGFAPLRQQTLARHAPGILGASIIALVAAHCLKFGMAAFTLAGAQINLPLLAIGFVFLGAPLMKRKVLIEAPVRTAPSAAE